MIDELFELGIYDIPLHNAKNLIKEDLFNRENIMSYYAFDEKNETMLSLDEIIDGLSYYLESSFSTISFQFESMVFNKIQIRNVGLFFRPLSLPCGRFVDIMMNFSGRTFFTFDYQTDLNLLESILKGIYHLKNKFEGERAFFGLDACSHEKDEAEKITTLLDIKDKSYLDCDFNKVFDFIYHQLSIE